MKALVCQSLGNAALSWHSVVEPKPDAGQLLVEVKAASVNFPDALVMQGRYQIRLQPPFIPGMEVSGEVIGVGVTWSLDLLPVLSRQLPQICCC